MVAAAAAYLAASTALRSRLLGFITAHFGMNGYRDTAAAAYVSSVVPVALAAQQAAASLTSAYLSHVIATKAGGTYRAPAVPLDAVVGDALRGTSMSEVYQRPFKTVYWRLSQGDPIDVAAMAGQRRAQVIAATDLELARTKMAQQVMRSDHRITGYRRVLNGPHSCALCVLASTQRYHKADLMPIHDRCDCGIEPLFNNERPDTLPAELIHKVIERDLGPKYVQAGGRGPIHYRDIVVTHDHGEIGPVLGVRRRPDVKLPEGATAYRSASSLAH